MWCWQPAPGAGGHALAAQLRKLPGEGKPGPGPDPLAALPPAACAPGDVCGWRGGGWGWGVGEPIGGVSWVEAHVLAERLQCPAQPPTENRLGGNAGCAQLQKPCSRALKLGACVPGPRRPQRSSGSRQGSAGGRSGIQSGKGREKWAGRGPEGGGPGCLHLCSCHPGEASSCAWALEALALRISPGVPAAGRRRGCRKSVWLAPVEGAGGEARKGGWGGPRAGLSLTQG